ncbi:MAG: NTP transferase domain-containing protein [Anaerorhabdus sp.]
MNANKIIQDWNASGKKHLLISGSIQKGKSTLFKKMVDELKIDAIYSKAVYEDSLHPTSVRMFNKDGTSSFMLAKYQNKMVACTESINEFGKKYLSELNTEIIGIDEIGYLEEDASDYLGAINQLFLDKRVVAVIRKNKSNHFLDSLREKEDAYFIDLDDYKYPVDVIVMASGYSKRFKKNKLLIDWFGKSLFEENLMQIPFEMVNRVVVVTRYQEIVEICKNYPVTCITSQKEFQSDTIALGLEALQSSNYQGVMFMTCDQPFRKKNSIQALILKFMEDTNSFVRLAKLNKRGNPVIFPKFMEKELRDLKQNEKGKDVLLRYLHLEKLIEVNSQLELVDIDTQDTYEELQNIYRKG